MAASIRTPLPGGTVDPEWEAITLEAGERLRDRGHPVWRADPPYARRDVFPVFARWFAGVADAADELFGDDRSGLQRRTRAHAGLGRWVRRLGGPRPGGRDRVRRWVEGFFTDYDVLITPALAAPPIPARGWARRSWLANVTASARYAPFAALWNLAGCPAGVVPVGVHSDGTPLAVQVVAPRGQDARVLRIMRLLEESGIDG